LSGDLSGGLSDDPGRPTYTTEPYPTTPLPRPPAGGDPWPVWDREPSDGYPTGDLPRRRASRGGWRPGWRPGPIGIAVIVASVLAAFGLGAALVSPMFAPSAGSVGTSAQTPPPPAAPVVPSDAASPTDQASDQPSDSASPTVAGDTAAEDAVVSLVNKERARVHCKPVRNDDQLRSAARGHSADMAAHNFFSHDGRDGQGFADRVRAAGYDEPLSENIAKGFRSPQQVMDGWLKSKGHRANINDCDARAVGVGVAVARDGTVYWTQDFGRQ